MGGFVLHEILSPLMYWCIWLVCVPFSFCFLGNIGAFFGENPIYLVDVRMLCLFQFFVIQTYTAHIRKSSPALANLRINLCLRAIFHELRTHILFSAMG